MKYFLLLLNSLLSAPVTAQINPVLLR